MQWFSPDALSVPYWFGSTALRGAEIGAQFSELCLVLFSVVSLGGGDFSVVTSASHTNLPNIL